MDIWTIGHSTLDLDVLIRLLHAHNIDYLADVRSFPGSRRFPHFNSDNLAVSLPAAGIFYKSYKDLGGRRSSRTVTPERRPLVAGWSNMSFQSYAAWTLDPQFGDALESLLQVASDCRVAFMCSEAVPWRCHRSILASVITDRGWDVHHIMGERSASLHRLGQWGPEPVHADGRLTWPDVNELAGILA